jgi:hypothetical protein
MPYHCFNVLEERIPYAQRKWKPKNTGP